MDSPTINNEQTEHSTLLQDGPSIIGIN